MYKTPFRFLGKFGKQKVFVFKQRFLKLLKIIEGSITNKIYHGCAIGCANEEKKLIDFGKGDRCLLPTNDPLWMEPRNLEMQTRNSEKKRPLLHLTFTTVKRLLEEKLLLNTIKQ